MKKPKRIRCTDRHGNVAYIHHTNHGWGCTLANGMAASMFYAVGPTDEMKLIFMLEDATSDEQRLRIVRSVATGRKVELVETGFDHAAEDEGMDLAEMAKGLILDIAEDCEPDESGDVCLFANESKMNRLWDRVQAVAKMVRKERSRS
jgi:hypothetical protein